MKPENNRAQAIVLGASLGGLMAARVLSNHYQKVIIIEKDEVNRHPESRKGQPQTRHSHAVLPGGFNIMTQYFPDLAEALAENGANIVDFAETMVWKTNGGYRKQFNKAAKVIDTPWALAVGQDFLYPETEGPKPPANDFINKYVSWVDKATLKDVVVCHAFLRVMSLLEPPTSLFHPRILWRVMRAAWSAPSVSAPPSFNPTTLIPT